MGEESQDDTERSRRTLGYDLLDMLKWAVVAAAITMVFGTVLNVLEALI
jgi:hypothetical protein